MALSARPSAAGLSPGTPPSAPAQTEPPPRRAEPANSRAWQAAEEPPAEGPLEPAAGAEPSPNANPDETNVWPDAAAEAAFLAETRGRGEPVTRAARANEEEEENQPKQMPKLDELVQQIPAETRELIEDLFRAKFVAVRRVKKSELKPEAG